jgi:predicted nucleotidyltransferase
MPDQLSEKLKQAIQAIGQEFSIRKIVIFGSRARGDAKSTGDIDLAVYTLPEFNGWGGLLVAWMTWRLC